MFKCKVCLEKDLRIVELKEQIAYFKNILNPPPRINKYELQEDLIMDGGGQEIIPIEDAVVEKAKAIEAEEARREEDRILTGNYEETEE